MICRAIRINDEMHCDLCHLRWPMDEEKPQPCRPRYDDKPLGTRQAIIKKRARRYGRR